MQTLKIKVTETEVTVTGQSGKLTAENVNQIQCSFDLPEAFDDLIVRAAFNGRFVTVEQGACFAPPLQEGTCRLGVYGYTMEGDMLKLRVSPSPCCFYVYAGSYREADVQTDRPAPTELEAHYNRIKELVDAGLLRGEPGQNYELTDEDKKEIAELVEIPDGSVTSEKLAASAVKNEQLSMYAVTESKLKDSAVTGNKIAWNTITGQHIKDGAVSAADIGNNAIYTRHVNDGAVTKEKLSESVQEQLNRLTKQTFQLLQDDVLEQEVAAVQIDGLNDLKEGLILIEGKGIADSSYTACNLFLGYAEALIQSGTVAGVNSVFHSSDKVNAFYFLSLGEYMLTYSYCLNADGQLLSGTNGLPKLAAVQTVAVRPFNTTKVLGTGTRFRLWGRSER